MAAPAGSGLRSSEHATELGENPGRSNRIVKQLFPEVPLRLGDPETRIDSSVLKTWLRKVNVMRWHHQLVDATDLPVDELS
jgi:hypothetical protein